ncbi:ZIP family metal transporter [Halorarum salinum]|uniref:ZIP family metal transporter n=1 Tax=Halorarum salinum TaxID=2743089 RepID=UPI001C531530|nr:ZIP family metal transporter [Halobaculum salinum]
MDPQRVRPAETVSVLQQQEAASGDAGIALVLGSAALLAAVHPFAGNLRVLDRVPRSRWLSFASGVSVAYAFVHLLPELEEGVEAVEGSGLFPAALAGRHVYLVALTGFTLFYGLERLVARSRSGAEPFERRCPTAASSGSTWARSPPTTGSPATRSTTRVPRWASSRSPSRSGCTSS